MKCYRCDFENIPGRKTCFHCNSILDVNSEDFEVIPPRAANWKRGLRSFFRFLRKNNIFFPVFNIKIPKWFKPVFSDNLIGLFFSIIPGLAHLLNGRLKEVKWYLLAWLFFVLVGLFCLGSVFGFMSIGIAIGLHAGIALQFGYIKELSTYGGKILSLLFTLGLLAFLYFNIPSIIPPRLTGIYSNMNIPALKLMQQDYVIGRRDFFDRNNLEKGDVVLVHAERFTTYGRNNPFESNPLVIGQIIAKAGDEISRTGNVFVVNGSTLDPERYPVPDWLQRVDFLIIVPENSYFVSKNFSVHAHNRNVTEDLVGNMSIVNTGSIQAKIFIRYWPLTKRGFLR